MSGRIIELPKDTLYTLPLKRFIVYLIGSQECVNIHPIDAESLKFQDPDERFVHVQYESFEGDKFDNPRVWYIAAWRACYTKWLMDKERSAKERKEANLLTENTNLLIRNMMKETGINDPEIFKKLAYKLARDKDSTFTETQFKTKLDMGE